MHFFLGYDQLTHTGFDKDDDDYDDGDDDEDGDDDDDDEDNNNKLRVLYISDRRPLSLEPWLHCVVDEDSSLYVGCDGSEVPFSSSLFTIQKTQEDNSFFIKVIKLIISTTKSPQFVYQ